MIQSESTSALKIQKEKKKHYENANGKERFTSEPLLDSPPPRSYFQKGVGQSHC